MILAFLGHLNGVPNSTIDMPCVLLMTAVQKFKRYWKRTQNDLGMKAHRNLLIVLNDAGVPRLLVWLWYFPKQIEYYNGGQLIKMPCWCDMGITYQHKWLTVQSCPPLGTLVSQTKVLWELTKSDNTVIP